MWLQRLIAAAGLLIMSPVLLPSALLIYLQDWHSPLYKAVRTAMGGGTFRMIKLRSMRVNADKTGVASTAATDNRITAIGHFVRRFKIDELMQLVNVAKAEMALVGPRPNLPRVTELYQGELRKLISVRPGITDFASIVYSDEGNILAGSSDPDADYERLIEPGKNRLGLFYVENRSTWLDLQLIVLTVVAIISKPRALAGVCGILRKLGAPEDLVRIASRQDPLHVS